jgi:hypothetical protein
MLNGLLVHVRTRQGHDQEYFVVIENEWGPDIRYETLGEAVQAASVVAASWCWKAADLW